MRWTIIALWIPRPAELLHHASVAEAGDRAHMEQHPGRRRDAVDAPEVGAQRAAVRAPPYQLLDDAAEPWTAFAEAGEGDPRVLRGIVRGHALNRQAGDGSRTRQRA
jgi:hypothetical protein